MSDASSGAPPQAADLLPDTALSRTPVCLDPFLCLLESPRFFLLQLSSALYLWPAAGYLCTHQRLC